MVIPYGCINFVCLKSIGMKYAIIAAGEGSRLAQEGIREPKPLVRVGGEALIDRLLRVFTACGADEICVLCNTLTTQVADHLSMVQRDGLSGHAIPLRWKAKTTPSSMHSFFELSDWLTTEPFVLTTVDTIFRQDEFETYLETFHRAIADGADGVMGVTDYIDDEKPLYVGVADDDRVTGFFDCQNGCTNISGGIYGLTPKSIATLKRCIERGESRMRNFQRAMIADGLQLRAFRFSKVLDIDHASDIQKAEAFLR